MKYKEKYTYHFFIALALIIIIYNVIWLSTNRWIITHCVYDSYTRQAAAWWSGHTNIPEDVSWLEIATYNGQYYISFPPFPTIIQFILYPIFGMNTPDNFINTLFGIGCFILIYKFLLKRDFSGFAATELALLMTVGSNLLYLSATGWVWFSAQTQSFFFSVLAVYLMYSKRKAAWYFSFLCLGIAFACRPFQLVYAPLLLYMLYNNLGSDKGIIRTLAGCIKYVLPLVFAGVCVAAYNYIRFGNMFEFGHNYLPEFQNMEQFSLSYVPGNLLEILKLPGSGELFWPQFNGTLFFLVNPVFIALIVSLVRNFGRKQAVYLVCFAAHFVLLLTHRTMGGWQFGARYLVDLIPFMLVVFESDRKYKVYKPAKYTALPAALALAGIAINIWGAIWLYSQNSG